MGQTDFKAVVLASEIDLGKIARHFGINRKFKWEDSLVLRETTLQGIIRQPENKAVYLFSFGSLVFINCQPHEITDIVSYLYRIEPSLYTANIFEFTDDYMLAADAGQPPALNNDYMVTDQAQGYQEEIVVTVLAKSVALDRIEAQIGVLLDEVEDIITYLEEGRLTVSDRQLAQLSARILGFKYNTISYIMLLDKPDIAWASEEADALYAELSTIFELDDRYEIIRHKTQTLMDITEVFSGLSHARRGTLLEWAVIILITIEICLSLFEIFFLNR
ncbi:conserved hypothetical protein [Thermosinus carboxydivorans Nor1]|uniref:DUF155 domain-containing protein n=1 Tax=Thermosinus carboxydivorans Nor1 TaxID=401526 RepID=A1HTK9_9FIRM|nr:RMD1 family protein [Thermosinus carboxydivorans]EAX46622.1 conserved hypothetical protein [Thermosinus carboxydivorans Nor1]